MNIEEQVCSLELANKLKALGAKQDSYFSWVGREHSLDGSDVFDVRPSDYREYAQEDEWTVASAFTTAELGEMLPRGIQPKNIEPDFFTFETYKSDSGENFHYTVRYVLGMAQYCICTDRWEADARAKMLCYLIEQGIITTKPLEL